MNLVIVGLAVLVIVLIYVLYKYYNNTSTTLFSQATLVSAQSPVVISDHPQSVRYAIGMWVYVQSWDTLVQKALFTIPNVFSVYLDKNTPTLFAYVSQSPSDTTSSTIIVTENFPLQRWTYVTVVADSQYVDIYLDGKMVKSVILKNPPTLPTVDGNGNVIGQIGYTLSGQSVQTNIMLSKVNRWSSPLSPQEVWNEYAKGNGSSTTFRTYGLSLNLTQDGTSTASYKMI